MTTKTDEQELLPCPFCGAGTTEVRENGRTWLGTRWGEPVSVSVRHWCDHVDGQPSRMIERVGRDRTSAIDAWNRRAVLQHSCKETSQAMSAEVTKRPISNETKIRINRNIALIKRLIGNGASKDLRDEADAVVSQLKRLKEHGISCAYTLQSQERVDAAMESVRKQFCALPRYSFITRKGGVSRMHDSTGNWIEFDQAHALFDPVNVDHAHRAEGEVNECSWI